MSSKVTREEQELRNLKTQVENLNKRPLGSFDAGDKPIRVVNAKVHSAFEEKGQKGQGFNVVVTIEW